MLYSKNRSAFTDATATQGIRLLNESIPGILGDEQNVESIERAMTGVALGTLGLIDPTTGAKYSVIHAFGHQIAQRYDVPQGLAHGVVAPEILNHIFDAVETNKHQLAEALGRDDGTEPKSAILERVRELRTELALPTNLRSVEAVERGDFSLLAEAIVNDIGMQFGPRNLSFTTSDVEAILKAAW